MSARARKHVESTEEDEEDKVRYVFDPKEVCNQVPHSFHYYNHGCEGLVYSKLPEKNQNEQPAGLIDKKDQDKNQSRPIKKVYINFDKDIANRMFGYRVKFELDNMRSYVAEGVPAVRAGQGHKPIHS